MIGSFVLDPRLEAGSVPLTRWTLCDVRLKDDNRFPWLLLVPRRAGLVELTDLGAEDYALLAAEIRRAVEGVQAASRPDKVNVAALGNQVPQLHVHVIARYHSDPAWPDPVWIHRGGSPLLPDVFTTLLQRYREILGGAS